MSQIILDFGSGNTCKNDFGIVVQMIDELKAIDTGKHEIIIKWQLFDKAGENIPLKHETFAFAYVFAKKRGYKTTASVFDKPCLDWLIKFDIPFVKIANNRSLDWLIGEVPRRIPIYVSRTGNLSLKYHSNIILLSCISKYPALIEEYIREFNPPITGGDHLSWHWNLLANAVSDHTASLDLFKKYQPAIWEKHYRLPDSTGLDAGPFAIMPEELREIL